MKGFDVTQTDDLEIGIKHADVIYSTRIQEERFDRKEDFDAIKDIYVLNREKVEGKCKKDVTILHPLPRTTEVAVDVDALPNAAYFRQSSNGVLVRMALFLLVLNKEDQFV
jgi:aspartate carbamoyltransferase catalytic subunit